MLEINDNLIDYVSQKAKESTRKRANYNFHKSCDECVQRFLNAIEPNSYVRPHKHMHSNVNEIFLILRGRVLVVEFNDKGEITNHVVLNFENGIKGVELPPNTWHSLITLEENSVLYEIRAGPYKEETDKVFADWAPYEGTNEAREFINKVLSTYALEA
ncbi:MAG: WbuC family cupin fold metalloprotein [Methanococcaceae archaeon]